MCVYVYVCPTIIGKGSTMFGIDYCLSINPSCLPSFTSLPLSLLRLYVLHTIPLYTSQAFEKMIECVKQMGGAKREIGMIQGETNGEQPGGQLILSANLKRLAEEALLVDDTSSQTGTSNTTHPSVHPSVRAFSFDQTLYGKPVQAGSSSSSTSSASQSIAVAKGREENEHKMNGDNSSNSNISSLQKGGYISNPSSKHKINGSSSSSAPLDTIGRDELEIGRDVAEAIIPKKRKLN